MKLEDRLRSSFAEYVALACRNAASWRAEALYAALFQSFLGTGAGAEGTTKVRHLVSKIHQRNHTSPYRNLARFFALWRNNAQ